MLPTWVFARSHFREGSLRLLKQVVKEAAGERRKRREASSRSTAGVFQRLLQFADGALKDRNLRHRIPRTLQLFADLILQVGRVADTIDQKIQEPLGWKQTLCFEIFNGFVADGHIGPAEMEHHIVVASLTDAFEPEPLHANPP